MLHVGKVTLPVMKSLVRNCGIDPLRGTAVLEVAVKEGIVMLWSSYANKAYPSMMCPQNPIHENHAGVPHSTAPWKIETSA